MSFQATHRSTGPDEFLIQVVPSPGILGVTYHLEDGQRHRMYAGVFDLHFKPIPPPTADDHLAEITRIVNADSKFSVLDRVKTLVEALELARVALRMRSIMDGVTYSVMADAEAAYEKAEQASRTAMDAIKQLELDR